jgi:hypothetical protein
MEAEGLKIEKDRENRNSHGKQRQKMRSNTRGKDE